MQATGQDNPTAGDRRRTPGVGQTVAIAGSIAAVLAGMFGLAAAEDDNPDLAPSRSAALRAAAPLGGAPPAAGPSRSDLRPYPAPAPFAVPPACRPAVLLAAGSTQDAPSHGLSMITPPKAPPPAPTAAARPPAGAPAARPCAGSTTTTTTSASIVPRPARPAKSHPAPKATGHPVVKHAATQPQVRPKH